MPRVEPIPTEQAPVKARELFDRFQAERGNVPNMFRTLAHRPDIMTAFERSMRAVFDTGTLPLRLKEMIAVRVSQVNGCRY